MMTMTMATMMMMMMMMTMATMTMMQTMATIPALPSRFPQGASIRFAGMRFASQLTAGGGGSTAGWGARGAAAAAAAAAARSVGRLFLVLGYSFVQKFFPTPEQPLRNIPGEMGAVFSKLFAALIGNREVRGSCCTLLAAYEALSQALSRAITLRRFVCSSLA